MFMTITWYFWYCLWMYSSHRKFCLRSFIYSVRFWLTART